MQCPKCFGNKLVQSDCPDCRGDGHGDTCLRCNGNGYTLSMSSGQMIACGACNGRGDFPCRRCNGTGMNPRLTPCPVCAGRGEITPEQHQALQQEKRRQEAEAKRRADEAAAEAARRYAADAPRRAAAELRARKEANTGGQFIYAWLGALAGCIPVVIMALSGATLELAGPVAGIIGPPVGAAAGLQIYFGTAKRTLVRAFLWALLACIIWWVIYIVIGIGANTVPNLLLNFLLPLVGTVIVAWGALAGGRKVIS